MDPLSQFAIYPFLMAPLFIDSQGAWHNDRLGTLAADFSRNQAPKSGPAARASTPPPPAPHGVWSWSLGRKTATHQRSVRHLESSLPQWSRVQGNANTLAATDLAIKSSLHQCPTYTRAVVLTGHPAHKAHTLPMDLVATLSIHPCPSNAKPVLSTVCLAREATWLLVKAWFQGLP